MNIQKQNESKEESGRWDLLALRQAMTPEFLIWQMVVDTESWGWDSEALHATLLGRRIEEEIEEDNHWHWDMVKVVLAKVLLVLVFWEKTTCGFSGRFIKGLSIACPEILLQRENKIIEALFAPNLTKLRFFPPKKKLQNRALWFATIAVLADKKIKK